jgi:Alginate export
MSLSVSVACGLFTMATGVAAAPADSPFGVPTPGISGQIRLRTEFDHKRLADPAPGTRMWTLERARLGYQVAPNEALAIKFEIQDNRVMGSEPDNGVHPATATVGNSKGLDLLQGYFVHKMGPLQMALGRQKMSLGAGRLLSSLEWNNNSRAFDGASANWGQGNTNATALLYLVADKGQVTTQDHSLLSGLYVTQALPASWSLDVYGVYDQSRLSTTSGQVFGAQTSSAHDLIYVGERITGKWGSLVLEEEFTWQAGELALYGAKDVSSAAFQAALRLGWHEAKGKVNGGVDVMSGDDGSDKTVSTLYRANYNFAHAYYGWMDYFVVNPRLGVVDLRLDLESQIYASPQGALVSVKAQEHYFLPQTTVPGVDGAYGNEVDIELHVSPMKGCTMVLGAGLFLPGDSASELRDASLAAGGSSAAGTLFYIMPTVQF